MPKSRDVAQNSCAQIHKMGHRCWCGGTQSQCNKLLLPGICSAFLCNGAVSVIPHKGGKGRECKLDITVIQWIRFQDGEETRRIIKYCVEIRFHNAYALTSTFILHSYGEGQAALFPSVGLCIKTKACLMVHYTVQVIWGGCMLLLYWMIFPLVPALVFSHSEINMLYLKALTRKAFHVVCV